MSDDYNIEIVIDHDNEIIHVVSDTGQEYVYLTDSVEGANILGKVLGTNVSITVYSQGQEMSAEEYENLLIEERSYEE